MTTTTALLNALAAHQGRASGISGDRLAQQLGLSPRQLRKHISQAREDGIAICGHPSSGYFMPTTPEELEESCDFLKHRAMHSLRKLSQMKKVALPILLGQLLLNQA